MTSIHTSKALPNCDLPLWKDGSVYDILSASAPSAMMQWIETPAIVLRPKPSIKTLLLWIGMENRSYRAAQNVCSSIDYGKQ